MRKKSVKAQLKANALALTEALQTGAFRRKRIKGNKRGKPKNPRGPSAWRLAKLAEKK